MSGILGYATTVVLSSGKELTCCADKGYLVRQYDGPSRDLLNCELVPSGTSVEVSPEQFHSIDDDELAELRNPRNQAPVR